MRTREARRMRNRALKDARKQGHDVALISKSGAIELYGCLNSCDAVMDIWDSPAIVNGSMAETSCPDADTRSSLRLVVYKKALKYFYNRAKNFCSLKRGEKDV